MNSIKFRHIVIGLVIIIFFILFFRIGNKDYSYEYSGAQSQIPIQSHSSYRSLNSEQYPSSFSKSLNPTNLTRHEILQTKLKGYRESTYWGEYTSTDEKVQDMSKVEFDRFVSEIELNDADVYWGANY